MGPEALPPHRRISSTPISTTDASSILHTYLTHSESHPHLHPDALITPSGVTFSSHGGPMGGVVMHNLRRVAAGLRGEYLEPEATPEPEEEDVTQIDAGKRTAKGKSRHMDGEGVGAAEEGWQNLSEYEREQGGIEVGEVGERDNFISSGGDAPAVQVSDGLEKGSGRKRKVPDDKDARKKAKKERNKEIRRAKEKQRANSDGED